MQNTETEIAVATSAVDVKLQMTVTVEEQVQVSAAVPDPMAADRNSDAVDLSDTLLRDLPADSQNIMPLLSNFVAPAAGGTEGVSLVVDGVEADQINDLPASAVMAVTQGLDYGFDHRSVRNRNMGCRCRRRWHLRQFRPVRSRLCMR